MKIASDILLELFGWALMGLVVTLLFITLVAFMAPEAQAQVQPSQYGLPRYNPPPSTRPYAKVPSTQTYQQLQDTSTTHYQVTPEYGYGMSNGESYSTRKIGNTTLINTDTRSITCRTVGRQTWCQ
jgi:hypothetical protein